MKWTSDERKELWECFVRSGGVRRGGYIRKVTDLYHSRNGSSRSGPSLVTQLRCIDAGGVLTEVEKETIADKVRQEIAEEERVRVEVLKTIDD